MNKILHSTIWNKWFMTKLSNSSWNLGHWKKEMHFFMKDIFSYPFIVPSLIKQQKEIIARTAKW